jgi:hypothetical protein
MRWLAVGTAVALLGLVAPRAAAETPGDAAPAVDRGAAAAASPRPLELLVGGHFIFAAGQVCRRYVDMLGCSNPAFTGMQLAPAWRPSPYWSLGAIAAFDWSGENDGATHTLWQAMAQARFRPWGEGSVEPWAGAVAGVMAATDTLDQAPATGDRSVTQYAPSTGLGLGTDFVFGLVSLGVEARGLFTAFSDPPSLGSGTARHYGDNTWLWLGVSLTFRPDTSGPQLTAGTMPRSAE